MQFDTAPRFGIGWRARSWALLATALVAAPLVADEILPPPLAESITPEVPAGDLVSEVRIVGNQAVTTTQISGQIVTRAGRAFDPSVVQRDVRKLATLGWFVDVKSLDEATPQGRIVTFQVVERPTIRWVEYLGNKGIRDKALKKETGLKDGGSVDPYSVEDGRRKLVEKYHGKGYNNAQITIQEGNNPTDQGVTYLIHEGQSQRVKKVRFIGNDFVSDSRLKTLIKSKPPFLKLFKGYLDLERIEADLEALTNYYRSFGFFQTRIGRQIKYDENGKWAEVTFVIHEGIQYKIRDVRFIGNTKFETAPLAETIELEKGEFFEQAKQQKGQQWLQELYGSHGHVFADIRPETVFLEEPGEVDLVYHIEEGKRFRVGNVIVHIGGDNPHTRIQTALNRVTLVPGQIFDIRELHASERRLMASSLYHVDAASNQRPKITYRIPDDADLEFAEEDADKSLRGQSPEAWGPPVLAPPSVIGLAPVQITAPPTQYAAGNVGIADDGVNLHVYCDDEAHFRRWEQAELNRTDPATTAPQTHPAPPTAPEPAVIENQQPADEVMIRGQSPEPSGYSQLNWLRPARGEQPHVVQRQPNPYENVQQQVRGQSPNNGYVNQAYATVPVEQAAVSPYGGQVVRATGPESAPVGSGVEPAQYSPQLQPPAGSVYPTPLNTQGPLPGGYSVDPSSPMYAGPAIPTYEEPLVDVLVSGNETQTGRLMVGVGVNSDAGVVGNIVVDERNFDWRQWPTSFEDIRNGSAFRGNGQRFRIDASPGSQVSRYLVSFQDPYWLDRPLILGLSGSYYDRRFRDWDEERLGGRVSLGKQWVERDLSATIAYRGENVNIHDPSNPNLPELAEVIGDNALHGFRLSLINDTRDSAFLATQGHYIEVGGEQVIGTFDYPRIDLDARQYWMLYERPDHSGRHVLSYSTTVGYTGTHTPIYEHFFAGGFATMRGFDFRGASPVKAGVEVGGEFQWLNSVQYLFPITADDMLHGVAFVDFGTVEEDVEIKDFRVAPGLGLRITVPAMGPAPIALDFAYAVSRADFDDREIFSFSLGFSR